MSWQRVRGHDALIEMFDRVVRRGRLAHAYLFTGPPGVGKHVFANELAKALLCEGPPPHPTLSPPGGEGRVRGRLEACDRCAACLQAEAGSHPDLFRVGRPEENLELPIKVMQDLCQGLALKPARGRRKIAIIDDADDFNEESANCFLKTLEEPPPQSLLLLVGTSTARQLPTIVSRCQVVRFAPLPADVVAELLRAHGVEDAATAGRLARLGGGSVGQALALADAALWQFRRTLLQGLARPPLDTVNLSQAWLRFVEDAGKEPAVQRRRAAQVLRFIIEFLHAALRLQAGAAPDLAEKEDRPAVEELAGRLSAEQLLSMFDRCHEAAAHLDRRVQLVLVLEALVDALGQRARSQPVTR